MSFVTMELAREIENDRILEQLTNKIKKIIPEIEIEVFAGNKEMRSSITTVKTRPITIEDILKCLIERNIGFHIQKYGENVISLFNNIDCYWELGKPLHKQSKYVIEELNNLI